MSGALYCIGRPSQEPAARPLPESLEETPISEDPKPALVQVEPYDALLVPGATQTYRANLYNARGQRLQKVLGRDAKFSVEGPGTIADDGTYTAPTSGAHETALVVCTVGELRGTARVRIVPPLPWKFDFNDAEKVPLTWVGGRVRYVIREQDGEKIAVKRSVLPTPRDPKNKLGARSRMWMGPTDMANYTIRADFALAKSDKTGKMSDFGLINSRYTMTARSSNKKLRLYSWSPHDYRTFAEVDFDPEPGKWYTMKLCIEPLGKTASVRGKLWPRGEAEPDEWTIAMTDDAPNLTGSPGFYGNAQEAEIFIDNVSVVSNQ